MSVNVFTDGASRGNPGDAGIGVAVYEGKELKDEIFEFVGKKTNNEAEYLALIKALKYLIKNKLKKANIFSDSEFLVKQLKGEYKVKADKVKPLFDEAQKFLQYLEVNFYWIPREENKLADSLANKGVDEGKKNKTVKTRNTSNRDNLNGSFLENLKLDKAFFGKVSCLKVQVNFRNEVYFHMGLLNQKTNNWIWEKVKMSDIELGEIVNVLRKDEGKCSFFHSFDDRKTQIWCNKSANSLTIKINAVSKNMTIGEFEVLRIVLEECIRMRCFD